MDVRPVIETKRDGGTLSAEEIERFLAGYVAGEVEDYHAAALLMAIFVHGMEPAELEHWTRAMLDSGHKLDFAHLGRPVVDKHSTGGVGDKASIPLAPAVAACGAAVPMISGRGLGHTGGTLDKLESIPGFRTDLSEDELFAAVEATGVALGGQTEQIAPADRKLYALRDATGLIESIPLIASSILSKKLAEGIGALVLDVKHGSGAFLPEVERGEELARTMLSIAGACGVKAVAYQTSMARPLGRAVGHTVEILECLDCLQGGGPPDLRELVAVLGGEMLALTQIAADTDDGRARIERALDDGRALAVFERVVEQQGGDVACLEERALFDRAPNVGEWRADRSGTVRFRDLRAVGRAVSVLGGGRAKLGDPIDPAVGLVFLHTDGDAVSVGDPICAIHHRDGRGLEPAIALLSEAVELGEPFEPEPLVLARLGGA
jgi:pyrimidine-nucleoside phosphorylase